MAGSILVIDGDVGRQRVLAYALRQEGYAVAIASDSKAGLKSWRSEKPALAVVDVDLPGGDALELLAKLRAVKSERHVPIVVITSADDPAQHVQVLRAGADDSVVRGAHPAELLARVRNLLSRFAPAKVVGDRPRRRGGIAAFCGARGGAGTTTLAVNTAIALHRVFGRHVALVDANLQFGDHRIFFDLPRDTTNMLDLVGAPDLDIDTVRSALVRHESGIDILLGPPTPTTAELVTNDDLPRILDAMRPHYDYIILDMDRRLDEYNLRLLDIADSLFVVLMADLPSLKNTRLLLETAANVAFPEDRVRLVLNRSTAATGINVRQAEIALEKAIDHSVINDYRAGITALNSGTPVFLRKADSALGKSILEFATAFDRLSPLRTRMAVVPAQP